jgi:hypothetical protein
MEVDENDGRKEKSEQIEWEKRRWCYFIKLWCVFILYKNDDDKWTVRHMGPIEGVTSLMQDFNFF